MLFPATEPQIGHPNPKAEALALQSSPQFAQRNKNIRTAPSYLESSKAMDQEKESAQTKPSSSPTDEQALEEPRNGMEEMAASTGKATLPSKDSAHDEDDTEQKQKCVDSKDATALTEDILNQIEPLPTPSQNRNSQPGAYSVGEPARLRGVQAVPIRNSQQTEEGPVTTDNIILGATVVDDGEEADMMEVGHMTINCQTTSPEEVVVDAKILGESNNEQPVRRICMILIVSLIFALATLCAILLGVTSSSSSSSNPDDIDDGSLSSPVLETTMDTLYPPFQNDLPTSTLKAIQDVDSPLYQANKWMLQDPNLKNYSRERQRQRFYMAMLYYATNGDSWLQQDGWMSYKVSECQWFTSSSYSTDSPYYWDHVCNENQTVVSLSLAKNNVTGSLPIFPTVFLPYLQVFDVVDNHIAAAAPPFISSPDLQVLAISHNEFSGSLRANGGFDFPKLQVVQSNGNQLQSGVPNRMAYMLEHLQHSLEIVNSTDNLFSGAIPPSLGLCTKLTYFSRGNLMKGTIPSEIGLLAEKLQHFDVSKNVEIHGTLPVELGALTALTRLDIAGTSITGAIPEALCNQAMLGILHIAANCSLVECCQ
ncbi:Leucine Rich Repeat [Seminavis robusta]|uniref:Leucine Rich Repeat n=1 Tax=Seminavis robusta TaxID=568900 RepID=A0A9N8EKI2_9STRA|nr:Leucine Rich Repeat [Seminavis robusta]|eukprot:Sro1113_g242620.1 Leucine Rich Repeat (594) ;mRNA; f:9282-11063